MNTGRKLDIALQTTAEISEKVFDLRVVLAKMSERQKDIYSYMIKGYDELETFVLAKRISEIAGIVPSVTTDAGYWIKTKSLKSVSDLDKLSPDSYQALLKIAKDHMAQSIGNSNYGKSLSDLQWYFQMIAPEAALTVTEIMTDKTISPKTRLTAANSLLDRAGYKTKDNNINIGLPVKVQIKLPDTYRQQTEVIEGDQ
ncbi:MAG TPA: hypothetical protein VLG12_07125 [Candidatus Saccharimonadales bacterium]|nr:hypothetical protein [Candidatus Saccharimonadales bacterium]